MRRLVLLLSVAAAACGPQGLNQVRPQLNPPGSPVDFGLVPVLNHADVEVPLLNLGRADMAVSNVKLGADDGVFTLLASPTVVTSGNTEVITLRFTPQAEAEYSNTLTFTTDDTQNAEVSLVLKGVGSTRAVMTLEPAMLDFGRVPECSSVVQQLVITSSGTADLVIEDIAFTEGTSEGFTFVGSTRTPAVVKAVGANGLPGKLTLTVKYSAAQGSAATAMGGIRLKGTDPDNREVVVPLSATLNQAPVASIAPLGNGAPGLTIALDGSASADPDGDSPLTYQWTLRNKPLASVTTIADPAAATTSMTLDPTVPGAYEVQLDVTDSQGVKSCAPARQTVVAAPAQKLLVELFWDNPKTDLDLHVLNDPRVSLFTPPSDCFYQNRTPDWGLPGAVDDPILVRDALTGYGPEVFGYVNPIDTTYRLAVVFSNSHLSPTPASRATVRVYLYGVLKAEVSKTLMVSGEIWVPLDITWPAGEVIALP